VGVIDGVIDGVAVVVGVGDGDTATLTVVSTSHGESESIMYILWVTSSKKVYPVSNSERVTPETIKLDGVIEE
jgi:ribose 5-phosphate isomerase